MIADAAHAGISIVIPVFRGTEHLRRHMPSLLDACERLPCAWEVLLVDDASGDGTAQAARAMFADVPNVRVIARCANGGFGAACNTGARLARFELVLFLNSDVLVTPSFLVPLKETLLATEDTFAVAPRVVISDGDGVDPDSRAPVESFTFCILRPGRLFLGVRQPSGGTGPQAIFYATGACVLIRRWRFLALGGFDAVYGRFYGEDVDLSYRAWKAGWKVLAEPRSVVYHRQHTTISSELSERRIRIRMERNVIIFTLVNFDDRVLLLGYICMLLPRIVLSFTSGDTIHAIGALAALARLPEVFRARKRRLTKQGSTLSDRDVLRLVSYRENA